MVRTGISLLISLLVIIGGYGYVEIGKNQIDNAVSIVKRTAIDSGYDVEDMVMMLKVNRLPLFLYSDSRGKKPESGPQYELLKKIEGKEFVSIYYKTRGKRPGDGDICIVLDANDWETIISIYENKPKEE